MPTTLKMFGFIEADGSLHGMAREHPVLFTKRNKEYEAGMIKLNRLVGVDISKVVPVTITFGK